MKTSKNSKEAMLIAIKDIRSELRKNHKTYINCSLKSLKMFKTLCVEHGIDNKPTIVEQYWHRCAFNEIIDPFN